MLGREPLHLRLDQVEIEVDALDQRLKLGHIAVLARLLLGRRWAPDFAGFTDAGTSSPAPIRCSTRSSFLSLAMANPPRLKGALDGHQAPIMIRRVD